MSARKFFKYNRSLRSTSTTARKDVIEDFISSNDEIEQELSNNNKRKHEINDQQQNDFDAADDFSLDSSGIDDDFEFDFDNDHFKPLFFRCSTPNHRDENVPQPIKIDRNERKINPWDKALLENESLQDWVKKFNEHIEMVDNTEVVIKKIKR
ncbi:uncharacterized protein LOC142597319 [Dermatophagoides farinae]|uniref:Uncharacterized protein n=1 Tax=Dermatophagoides farinae TaxID=6954 RepID=A0A922HXU1_DERFA|nr:hypothetical protein HUG17_1278 [Dermatophagoides farinae]KAH9515929.1 hypothetical protein DERF_006701 [Dermatophagoides farinae]